MRAPVSGGPLLPVYYFMVSIAGAGRGEGVPKDRFSGLLVTGRGKDRQRPAKTARTIVFEARAYISYNLKFVY
jgi:hypothetical protein